MIEFPNAEKVCQVHNPLDWTAQKNQLMVDACREFAEFHQKNCEEIKELYAKYNFDPKSIESESDLQRIPSLGVTAMKYFLLTSMPHDKAVLKLTSSGTRGQKTQIWMDQASFDRCQKMLDVYWEQENFSSNEASNYLIFSYNPDHAQNLGIAYTEKNQLRFSPVADCYFAINKDENEVWQFDKEEAFARLEKYASQNKPVRVFGMPAFIFDFLEFLKDRKKFRLPKNSLVMTGGGWKAAEDKKISRAEFRRIIKDYLGIPDDRIRDAYGMAEHCAPYFECSQHRFHIPVFTRIFIRDPITLGVLEDGKVGLMELVTPFNAMMPNLSILTTDFGQIDAAACPCGQKSPTFTLHGRAGLVKHKGCALNASDIVRRSK